MCSALVLVHGLENELYLNNNNNFIQNIIAKKDQVYNF